ncbi:hypothetical protein B0H13DRAFT_2686058 [Mycena leptocephala]|nr:hypothetical protein B0H13DRAFT_2686058 [Mycena leptocephala]
MIVPKDPKEAAVDLKPLNYESGSGAFDNKDSKLKTPNVPEQSQQPVTSLGSSSQGLRCTECGSHKVSYDSAPIAPRNIHGRRFKYAGAYLALFVVIFAIAEVVAESLGGQITATGIIQIIVAFISAGTGATLVKLLRLGRRTQPTKTRFCVLCGLGSGWICLAAGVIPVNAFFYTDLQDFPAPFPSCPLFTVVSVLSGGLLITLVGAACAEYHGFRRVNKQTIAPVPGNL